VESALALMMLIVWAMGKSKYLQGGGFPITNN